MNWACLSQFLPLSSPWNLPACRQGVFGTFSLPRGEFDGANSALAGRCAALGEYVSCVVGGMCQQAHVDTLKPCRPHRFIRNKRYFDQK